MLSKIKYAVLGVVAVPLLFAGTASAQTFDPAAETTSMATGAVETMGPIVLALGGAVIGLAVVSWGVRAVLRLIKSGGKSVG